MRVGRSRSLRTARACWKQHIRCCRYQQVRGQQSGGVRMLTELPWARSSLFCAGSSDQIRLSFRARNPTGRYSAKFLKAFECCELPRAFPVRMPVCVSSGWTGAIRMEGPTKRHTRLQQQPDNDCGGQQRERSDDRSHPRLIGPRRPMSTGC